MAASTLPASPQWSRGPRTAVTYIDVVRAAEAEAPQWSRGPRTAVTTGLARGLAGHCHAAMEPRSEDRGDAGAVT